MVSPIVSKWCKMVFATIHRFKGLIIPPFPPQFALPVHEPQEAETANSREQIQGQPNIWVAGAFFWRWYLFLVGVQGKPKGKHRNRCWIRLPSPLLKDQTPICLCLGVGACPKGSRLPTGRASELEVLARFDVSKSCVPAWIASCDRICSMNFTPKTSNSD